MSRAGFGTAAGAGLLLAVALLGAACGERAPRGVGGASPPPTAAAAGAGQVTPAVALSVSTPGAAASAAAAPTEAAARVDGMILVPGGSFTMGSDTEGERDERPAHTVTVSAFYLDETEVTNEAYARGIDAGICRTPSPRNADLNNVGPDKRFRGSRQPVSSISWDDARAYCAWAGKRLPTEAEWERAARGDDGRRFPWGNEAPSAERAVFSSSVTAEVGSRPAGAGPFGHADLAGNVWEWLEDVYDPYAYSRPEAARGIAGDCRAALAAQDDLRKKKLDGFTGQNPIPTECERVLRGGAFNYNPSGLRSSNRVHHPGRFRLVMSGFRCARDVAPR